jgi:nucleoside-diphosphate-sugar epimerase
VRSDALRHPHTDYQKSVGGTAQDLLALEPRREFTVWRSCSRGDIIGPKSGALSYILSSGASFGLPRRLNPSRTSILNALVDLSGVELFTPRKSKSFSKILDRQAGGFKMAVMITGGTGFLGSYLTRHLVREKSIAGKDLVLFDRYPNKDRIADVLDQVIVITGDVTEPTEVAAAIKTYDVDQIYHLAAILGDPTPTQVVSYMKVMCDGTLNVFESARILGVKRVVYASSVAVFGRASFRGKQRDDELDEDDPPSPGSFYGMCKLYSENLAALYSRRFGLETVGLRPTSVFGVGRGARGSYASGLLAPQDVHYMVLPELAALGKPVQMPPDETESDWIYAADAAEAWYRAMNTPKPPRLVYNLAAERRRMADVTAHLRNLLPEAQIGVSEKRVGTVPNMNCQNLRKDLGFEPRYTMETGLTHYLNSVRKAAGLPPVRG